MKYILIAAFFVAQVAFAQDKKISLEGYGYIKSQMLVGESGLALAVDGEKKKVNLKFFDTDLDLVWQKEVDAKYSSKTRADFSSYDMTQGFLVSSPSGSVVYYLEFDTDDYYQKDHYVSQITKAGDLKKFTIKGREELGYSPQTVLCDDQYFYILATEEGFEANEKKKDRDKLILNRFDATTFAYKKVVLDLPVVESGGHTTFWSFLGQSATEKFLYSKNVNSEKNQVVFSFAAFDQDGKITHTWKVEPDLKGTFFRPTKSIADPRRSFHQIANLDYVIVMSKSGATGMSYPEPRLDYNAFSNAAYDEATDSFYIFGLSGPKEFKKVASVYDGFYVLKYDSQGALQWQTNQKAPKQLADYGAFRVHSTPGQRNVTFRFAKDNSLNFSVQTKKLLATFVLDAQGKVVRTLYDNDFIEPSPAVYQTAVSTKTDVYIKKSSGKKRPPSYERYVLTDREILLENPWTDPSQLLIFKK